MGERKGERGGGEGTCLTSWAIASTVFSMGTVGSGLHPTPNAHKHTRTQHTVTHPTNAHDAPVEVVQVDLVDAEPREGALAGAADVRGVAVGDLAGDAGADAELGREEDVGALAGALEPGGSET